VLKNFIDRHSVVVGFLMMVLAISLASAQESEPFEHFTANIQSTYVWQKHPQFGSFYDGPSSLSPNQEIGYTLSATAFLGFRPWKGTEFFVDPEVTQGLPFSGLRGLGGMTNGEAQKAGSTDPIAYWSRRFVRQTFAFGGGTVEQEAGFNQFAGSVDKRRLVITAGVFAATDIFDQNTYAHDPRINFLNWSMMDYGAWEMPADARGYTRGLVFEYYHDDWAVRLGRMLLPVESNGLQLNGNFSQSFGDNLEIEHAHRLGEQPGRVRLLLFRNQANMGSWSDAIAYSQAYGGTPDVANVRTNQVKSGFGISIEQALNDDIGVFARYSKNNGAAEAYSFAQIDNSLSFGVSIKGTSWSRPNDTVGLGVAINGISSAHVDYLNAGGQGFFCGDGQLTNPRKEQVFEAFYSAQVSKGLWATVDYQRIHNPCYNADRGPVNVYSLRLHMEF
jgi:high affinity Mn2+ porin